VAVEVDDSTEDWLEDGLDEKGAQRRYEDGKEGRTDG